ELAGIGIATV
nr:Chain C, L8A heteroclitic Melanoma peptide [synthetic construct]4JFQ_F Chain F, L8A heteroclitic Melanoma peptide [synthetic construct]